MLFNVQQVNEIDATVMQRIDDNHGAMTYEQWVIHDLIQTLRAAWSDNQELSRMASEYQDEAHKVRHEIASHAPDGRNYTNGEYVSLLLEHERVKQERDDYRTTLEWYADKSHHRQVWVGDELHDWGEALDDKGKRAADILAKYSRDGGDASCPTSST